MVGVAVGASRDARYTYDDDVTARPVTAGPENRVHTRDGLNAIS
jgi:hypothetical protein